MDAIKKTFKKRARDNDTRQDLFSEGPANLSPEEVPEFANKRRGLDRKDDDTASASKLSNKAKPLLKGVKKFFTSKKDKDRVPSNGIANAPSEHGGLSDDLRHHDKEKESRNKPKKWKFAYVISRPIGSSRVVGKGGTIHQALLPTPALFAVPAAMCPNKDAAQIPQEIFDRDIAPLITKYTLPETNQRMTSTPQLAYCLSLLHSSMVSKKELDQSERDWLQAITDDHYEQERLRTMATDLIRAFIQEGLKKPDVVAEVVSLATILEQDDFRKLLQAFVDGINQSLLLDVHLLNGLAQLIRNAAQEYINVDDLVKILELLNARLKDVHNQSTQRIYQLALTISNVLDSMVDSQVEGLCGEQFHESLSDYFERLQESSDPRLIYQAAYAYQALQYIPDDKTILQSMMRRTGKAVQGISGVMSAVQALNLTDFIEGLQSIQQGLAGAEKVIGFVSDVYSNAMTPTEEGQGLLVSLKEGFNFKCKGSWYPALRGLDRLAQEGRFADFEKLVREVPCRHDPAFRLGVCQRLGEIAASPIWDLNTRKCAVKFLRQLYKDNANYGQQVNTNQWILYILNQVAESSKDIVEGPALELLQEAQANSSSGKGVPRRGSENDNFVLRPVMVIPEPTKFQLLDFIQNKPDAKAALRQLRLERRKDQGGDVYISPRAKSTPRATCDFDLTAKVREFLASDGKVFLVLGDSGVGKSTFNRALEISLWEDYDRINGRIPLFIHLPSIEKPERDLIVEKLRKANFTESQILELRKYHEFILICDGYDESQQTQNLYMSNRLNQPGGWRAQMVISCRTEYNGVEYRDYFQPTDRNNSGDMGQFQEAIISPFTKEQIQDYIGQYVTLKISPWKLEDYLRAFEQVPNLQDLVKNPFLLKLSLEVLPRLSETNTNFPSTRITRVQLYDEFVAQWIDRGKIRLREMELSPYDKGTLKRMAGSGFRQHGIIFLKELAAAIYEHQNGNPVVRYSVYKDRRTWKEAFFSEREGVHLLREVIPLTRNGDQYQFIHKSLLEYGLSLAIFGPSKLNEETEPAEPTEPAEQVGLAPPVSRRGGTISVFSFEHPFSTEETATVDVKSLLDSPLRERNLVEERSVLQFLTERVQQEAVFKDQLHSVIEKSKTDKDARVAAANAITILVRAGVQFIGADLRNIKIPRADLSYGVFDSAQLQGADLRKVNLRNVWMRQANLSGAQMKGAQFGELPYLEKDGDVLCSAYSPDGETYAAGLSNGSITLYEASRWIVKRRLKGHSGDIDSLSFSATSNQIVSGSSDFTVRLWDVETGECIHTLEGHSRDVNSVVYSPKGDRVASGSSDSTVRLWDVKTGKCIHIFQGHDKGVSSVVYSPKGNRVASGSEDSTVRLWDVETGKCVHTLKGHNENVTSVVYSPEGDRIASGSWDFSVRLWDAETGECVHTLKGHTQGVSSIVYSPKGDRIASGSWDYSVRLWDVKAGECVHTLQGHSNNVASVVYSPEGNRVASGSWDYSVRLWNAETGRCVHTLKGHSQDVTSIVYSPKGDRIASGSRDSTVRLWDVGTDECTHALKGHSQGVTSVAYSPNGDQIASGSWGSTVRLWDVKTGECVHTLQGHGSHVKSVVYSPEGDRIASGSVDFTVRLWDVKTGECVHTLQGHSQGVNCTAYSPKGNRVASGSEDSTVRLWDVETGKCVHSLEGHSRGVTSVTYSPKGDQIASGSWDSTVRLWDVEAGECAHILRDHILRDYTWAANSIAYLPNGDRIASGNRDKVVRLWDVDTGKCLHTLQGHNGNVNSVVCSPKRDQIASGSRDSTVRLWDVDTGECVHTLQGHSDYVNCVMYSPNGDRIASGSDDWTVRLWNVDTGECIHVLQGHGGCVRSVVYSPRGDQVASGSNDRTVWLWDVDTGECVHSLQGHIWTVNSVTYSPKGDRIASGSDDSTVRLWDVDTGECVHILQGHTWAVNSVAYSPKGDLIASGSGDKTVRLWNVDTGECIHILQGHGFGVNNVVYSPKGDQIASGSDDSTVRLWSIDTGKCIRIFRGRSGDVTSVTYSPKGDQIASGSWDSTVRLLDVEAGECAHILRDHILRDYTWAANSIAYLPNGDRIASGNRDKVVRLWDVDTGKCLHTLQGHNGNVNSVVCSPKRDQIASGSRDSTVRLWDVDTGECVHTLQGHSDYVNCVMYSPNGDRIASGSDDWTVRLWNVDTGECIHVLQGHGGCVRSVVYSPRGDQVASGSNDRTVWLWDVDTGECVHSLQGHIWTVNSVTYSPKGDRIASGSDDSTVRLWDVDTGECVHILQGHTWAVNSVAYSPKGDLIASGSGDKTVRLWNVDTGECIHILQGHGFGVNNVVYSPKGDQIASGSDDSTVRLWSIDTGKCIRIFRGRSGDVNSIVYSPKGDRIAFGGSELAVRLWDVTSEKCVHTLQDSGWTVNSAVYSPKGDQIASGSWDSTVRLLDVEVVNCAHILRGHSQGVNCVVYSPEGDQIASGSEDSTVRLWDVNTGECVYTLQGHSSYVNSVVYSPKGDQIASGSDDNTLKLWSVETGQCLATISGFSNAVSSIALESSSGIQYLVTGSFDKSVRRWRIIKEGAKHKAVLCWSSSHEVLTVHDMCFEGVQDLSSLNRELLIQRGALIPTHPAPRPECNRSDSL